VEQGGIEDRTQVDLRHTHTARRDVHPDPLRRPTTYDLETTRCAIRLGQAHRVRDPVVSAGQGRDRAWHRAAEPVPECGDRRHAHEVRLAAVGGDRCEIRQHSIVGNESECLDHRPPPVAIVRPHERRAQSCGDQRWLETCPLGQHPLRVHTRQMAGDEDVHQGFEQFAGGRSTCACPGRMRGQGTGT